MVSFAAANKTTEDVASVRCTESIVRVPLIRQYEKRYLANRSLVPYIRAVVQNEIRVEIDRKTRGLVNRYVLAVVYNLPSPIL